MIPGVSELPFAQRACFAAGQAKSGTTLLIALLDGHPQLLVLPEETAYFPTALNKYEKFGRRAQVEYLTNEALVRVLFGGPPEWEKTDYGHFPTEQFREQFEATAFDPNNADKDLLVLLMETYAEILGVQLESIVRWVEKTPANRRFIPQILERFPQTKFLITMRDPRAILAAQIALEKKRRTREFSVYYCVSHWLQAAQIALCAQRKEISGIVVRYEDLVADPAPPMERVCDFLKISFDRNIVLTPTKAGKFWAGNSATDREFTRVSGERAGSWQNELSMDEIGWVEWHCRQLMPHFGYTLRSSHRSLLHHWARPIRQERPKQYFKSRYYSVRDKLLGPRNK